MTPKSSVSAVGHLSELKLVTLSVSDLERSVGFYSKAFDLEEVERQVFSGDAWEKLWAMPEGLAARACTLGRPGTSTGRVRLVEFASLAGGPDPVRIWGDYERIQDLGHFAVNFRVRDLRKRWPMFLEAGASEKSAPRYWEVDETLQVWDSQCFDPDGVLLDVFEIRGSITETLGEVEGEASEVQTMAVHCSDARTSQSFYQGLGYDTVLYDTVIENLEDFFGVPQGVKLHNVNLMQPSRSPNGRIELAHYLGLPGNRLADRAVPPNLGILHVSFETSDLEAALREAERLGGRVACPPMTTNEVRYAMVHGPDGEALEIRYEGEI